MYMYICTHVHIYIYIYIYVCIGHTKVQRSQRVFGKLDIRKEGTCRLWTLGKVVAVLLLLEHSTQRLI